MACDNGNMSTGISALGRAIISKLCDQLKAVVGDSNQCACNATKKQPCSEARVKCRNHGNAWSVFSTDALTKRSIFLTDRNRRINIAYSL